jgi:seryl-tRNA synthetase|tara:strand:+ start:3422 stop:4690 length:1269 start_codon:yes stop_codon:yes gene_type:complete
MLDIQFIRDNKDLVKEGARKKHIQVDIDALVELDDKRRAFLALVEEKRAAQNEHTDKIASESDSAKREAMISDMRNLKQELQVEEAKLKGIMRDWQALMVQVPNVPDVSVPEGVDDSSNEEVKKWGIIPTFEFGAKSHTDLMTKLDMVDFERGTKVAGFRGYILKNDGAKLNFAVWQFIQDHFSEKDGFVPMVVPSLVRREPFLGTGYIPQGEEDLYKTQDESYLSGTAEVATMSYYMDEVLPKKQLPVKMFAFSPCFRREAGSHGKDTKGLMRVHEFFKFEQVVLCEADHEESVKWHEWINKNTEEALQKLNIPYRTVINCGGDLGLGQVKKYDIELWVPSEEKYREISSASYFHDFQTRRLNIRYRDDNGVLQFAHSLNCTALPTPRILIAIIENNQQADGSIVVPEALRPYLGVDVLGS